MEARCGAWGEVCLDLCMSPSCDGMMAAALRVYTNHVLSGSRVVTPALLITGLLLVNKRTGLRALVRVGGQREAPRSPRAGGLDVDAHRVSDV